MNTYDAIVVGGGHNGLVAALYLARAGWSVAVVERNDVVGGAITSAEVTLPGFVHDVFSTNQNLFLSSAAYADFKTELTRHGLRFRTTDRPYSNVFPDGRSVRVYRDYARTLSGLEAHNPRDAQGFEDLYQLYRRISPQLFAFYGDALRPATVLRALVRLLRRHGFGATTELARVLLMTTRELGETYFASPEAQAMAACWGMHLDFAPDIAGGAVFPLLELFADMENGMAVVEGGAQHLPRALTAVLGDLGGEVHTGLEVEQVLCANGRAVGVRSTDGTVLRARRAVVANVGPRALYERLVTDVPHRVRRQAVNYRYGPGTLMLHLAVDGALPWAAGDELAEFGYVHVGPYVNDLARSYTEAQSGLLPTDPLLVVGQTSAIDPTRAPDGRQVVWIQVRTVPSVVLGDAAGTIRGTRWPEVAAAMADRVLAKLERYAPGTSARIADRAVYTPQDLEATNPNLVGGDSVGGSHHLTQNLVFRPMPGHSGYRTAIRGLYLTGAATWPGAGNNATSGRLAARQVLRDARWPHRGR